MPISIFQSINNKLYKNYTVYNIRPSIELNFENNYNNNGIENVSITTNGSMSFSTAQKKYGSYSLLFPTTNNNIGTGFNSSKSYVKITNNNGISFPYTICMWIYITTTSAGNATWVDLQLPTNYTGTTNIYAVYNNAAFGVGWPGTGGILPFRTASPFYSLNTWYHTAVVVYSSSSAATFLNGTFVRYDNNTYWGRNTTQSEGYIFTNKFINSYIINLGWAAYQAAPYGDPGFIGYMDQFLFYNYALTSSQINQIATKNITSFSNLISVIPKNINFYNIIYWFDASNYEQSSTGTLISRFVNKSYIANNAILYNTTSPTLSTTGLNSMTTMVFPGNAGFNAIMPINTFKKGYGLTVFIVYKYTSLSASFTMVGGITATNTTNAWPDPFDLYNTNRLIGNAINGFTSFASSVNPSSTPCVYCFSIDGSKFPVFKEWVNGGINNCAPNFISGAHTSPVYTAVDTSKLGIGIRADGGTQLNGNISEIIIYNTMLTESNRKKIEGYLAWKWGLKNLLPYGHPYSLYVPTTYTLQEPSIFQIDSQCISQNAAISSGGITINSSNYNSYYNTLLSDNHAFTIDFRNIPINLNSTWYFYYYNSNSASVNITYYSPSGVLTNFTAISNQYTRICNFITITTPGVLTINYSYPIYAITNYANNDYYLTNCVVWLDANNGFGNTNNGLSTTYWFNNMSYNNYWISYQGNSSTWTGIPGTAGSTAATLSTVTLSTGYKVANYIASGYFFTYLSAGLGTTLNTAFTYEIWCCPLQAFPDMCLIMENGQATVGVSGWCDAHMGICGSLIRAGLWSGSSSYVSSTSTVVPGTWYHIVETYASSVLTLYVNGITQGTLTVTRQTPPGGQWLTFGLQDNQTDLGSTTGMGFFNGYMGSIRLYNSALTSAQVLQNYNAEKYRYVNIFATASIATNTAQGATVTSNGVYRVFKYNASGNFTLASSGYVSALIVGGGGGGGYGLGAGGGGGGVVYFDVSQNPLYLAAGTYPVTVGNGGNGATSSVAGTVGSNSSFASYVANGGGGGGSGGTGNGSAGGCGGGNCSTGAYSVSNQTNYSNAYYSGGCRGGNGPPGANYTGGGGGAGGVGNNGYWGAGGHGGEGYLSNITNTLTYYGGGGGAAWLTVSKGFGGFGGGGDGGLQNNSTGSVSVNGLANTGGGGGGGCQTGGTLSANGASGGSGVVIILCNGV